MRNYLELPNLLNEKLLEKTSIDSISIGASFIIARNK